MLSNAACYRACLLRFKVISVLLSCFSFFSRIDSLPELLIHLQHRQPIQDYANLCNKHPKPAKHLLHKRPMLPIGQYLPIYRDAFRTCAV